jgi:ATP synthase protein I
VSGPRDFRWGGGWYGSAASTKAAIPKRDRRTDDEAWTAFSHLVAGMLLYGGLGWLIGTLVGYPAPFLAGGVVFGVGMAYVLIYRRFGGTGPEPVPTHRAGPAGPAGEEAAAPMDHAGMTPRPEEDGRGR